MWAFRDSQEVSLNQLHTGFYRCCVEENATLNQTELIFHGTFQKRESPGAWCNLQDIDCHAYLDMSPTHTAYLSSYLKVLSLPYSARVPRFLHEPRNIEQVKGSTALPLLNHTQRNVTESFIVELIRRMSSDRLVMSLSTSSKSRDMQQTVFLIIIENPLDFLPQLMQGLLEVQHHF